MPRFAYKAYNKSGRITRGTETAADMPTLEALLREQSLFLFHSVVRTQGTKRQYRGRVPRAELIHFTEQLAIVVRSGIPILAGLDEIQSECRHPGFRSIIQDIHARVADGTSIAQALGEYPRVFDQAYVSVVAAGEETGSLDAALEKMAQQMAWIMDTKRQVRGAMIQPAILLVAVTGLTILVVTVLVPKITEIFQRSNTTLPGITQGLVNVSSFLQHNWKFLLIALALFVVSMNFMGRTRQGRMALDRLKLRIPVLGHVIALFAASRFANLFGLLNDAGVSVDRNLEIVEKSTGNAVYNAGVRELRRTIVQGGTIAEGITKAEVFPSLVVRMMRIGEQTGEIPNAMERICQFYDKEIPRALKKVTTVLQPLLMMGSAAVVCFVIFAAFMPIVKLVSGGH